MARTFRQRQKEYLRQFGVILDLNDPNAHTRRDFMKVISIVILATAFACGILYLVYDECTHVNTNNSAENQTLAEVNEIYRSELEELWPVCSASQYNLDCSEKLDNPEKREYGYCSQECFQRSELRSREDEIVRLQKQITDLEISALLRQGEFVLVYGAIAVSKYHLGIGVLAGLMSLFNLVYALRLRRRYQNQQALLLEEDYNFEDQQERLEETKVLEPEKEEDDRLEDSRDELERDDVFAYARIIDYLEPRVAKLESLPPRVADLERLFHSNIAIRHQFNEAKKKADDQRSQEHMGRVLMHR